MPTFEIPIGPPISENQYNYLIHTTKPRHPDDALTTHKRGSITYDREKGGMILEWANESEFRVWRAAEEAKKSIKLIVSVTKHSKSQIWRERRVLRCSREFTGGRHNHTKRQNLKIPSKKSGCQCHLIIKFYPHTDTILGKYEGHHDHPIADANVRFTRLSDKIKHCVMDMVRTGIASREIVSVIKLLISRADSYSVAKTRAGVVQGDRSRLPHHDA